MLKKETIEQVEKLLKIKTGTLATAIADAAEVDVPIDDKLSVLSDDEVTTLKTNSYKDGKKAGVEMEVDAVKKELNLDFTGKTIKGLLEAGQKKAIEDAKIAPDQKVTELEGKLKTAQETATDFENKWKDSESKLSSTQTEGLIAKDMPESSLPASKVLLLMKADGYEFKNEEGKIVWYKAGRALTDRLGNNLDTKAVASEYITAEKLDGTPPGGRGKGDEKQTAGAFMKASDIRKKLEAEGKNLMGEGQEEYMKLLEEASKIDGFDPNS